jgi:hypothetical protein
MTGLVQDQRSTQRPSIPLGIVRAIGNNVTASNPHCVSMNVSVIAVVSRQLEELLRSVEASGSELSMQRK